jgi:hypothetical protein
MFKESGKRHPTLGENVVVGAGAEGIPSKFRGYDILFR